MKIDHQENCEYRFSSIVLDLIDLFELFWFVLFSARLALFAIKGKESKENFNCWVTFSFDQIALLTGSISTVVNYLTSQQQQ